MSGFLFEKGSVLFAEPFHILRDSKGFIIVTAAVRTAATVIASATSTIYATTILTLMKLSSILSIFSTVGAMSFHDNHPLIDKFDFLN